MAWVHAPHDSSDGSGAAFRIVLADRSGRQCYHPVRACSREPVDLSCRQDDDRATTLIGHDACRCDELAIVITERAAGMIRDCQNKECGIGDDVGLGFGGYLCKVSASCNAGGCMTPARAPIDPWPEIIDDRRRLAPSAWIAA
jgi:hypothetical protein